MTSEMTDNTETAPVALAVAMGRIEEGMKHVVEGLVKLESKVDNVGGQVANLAIKQEVTSEQVAVLHGRVDVIETSSRTALERTGNRKPTPMTWVMSIIAMLALIVSAVGVSLSVSNTAREDMARYVGTSQEP